MNDLPRTLQTTSRVPVRRARHELAIAPHRFGDRFFAALAGITDPSGDSPFWKALDRTFFQIDFQEAGRLTDCGRHPGLIIERMPHYRVYVPLLPAEASAAMGQVHAEGTLPLQTLSYEGVEADKLINIFDGGPVLQAHKHALQVAPGDTVHCVKL